MKKMTLNGGLAIASILAVAPILTNCGQNSSSTTSAIGYDYGTVASGCLAITGPIPFSVSNASYDPQDSGTIVAGRLLRTVSYPAYASQNNGTVTTGGSIITGPLVGGGTAGTLAMTVATVVANPANTGYFGTYYGSTPALATAVGTLTLSALAQQQILQASGYGSYGSAYGNGYGTTYPYGTTYGTTYPYGTTTGYNTTTASVCISSMAINLRHVGSTLTGSVELYFNNNQSTSQVVTF